ncbi:MAG: orotate phosphoribosyltransferase [Lachnospiraceae bacterium]|nr:orotate phosphoribosyltransferase [Lachnospiraceae bacterium]MBR6487099.1 orotate phosphoribosyltransferase [Lachnospiraceae bacterium]
MQDYKKIDYAKNKDVVLRYIPGHFVTPNSHVNYYMDLTDMKSRQREARATGEELAEMYLTTDIIDTILCLNGMEVVGAYLANKLTKAGIISANRHQTMYITSPEYNVSGQMMFRENNQHMIRGKKVLILIDTATTGDTLRSAVGSVKFYGGQVVGISAIYSVATQIEGFQIRSLYSTRDLPDYMSYRPASCPLCESGTPVDAICNGFGYSTL